MSSTYIHTKRKPGFSQRIVRILAILYFITLAASIVYLWGFTRDRFVSTAEFRISRQDSAGADAGLMQLALPGLADSGSMDSQIAISYIGSADLLIALEKQFDLVAHYTSPARDPVFRMDPTSNLEERLEYYRRRIVAHFDKERGMTVITVDTFKPELSRAIAAELLKKAEAFVNVVNQDIADQQLGFVRNEVERTTRQVDEVSSEILKLQNEHHFINPEEAITANLKAVETMRMEQIRANIELSSLLRDSPNSPRIESVRSRIHSLDELINAESAKLTGPEKDRLSQLQSQFKQLELKLDFSTRLRAGAEMMMEKNRVEAISRTRFFTVIQNPYLPEDVAFPRRPYATVSILGLGFLIYLICRALLRSVFERA